MLARSLGAYVFGDEQSAKDCHQSCSAQMIGTLHWHVSPYLIKEFEIVFKLTHFDHFVVLVFAVRFTKQNVGADSV